MNEHSEEGSAGGAVAGAAATELTTGRLVLRAPRLDDAAELASIANNRGIAEQTRRMPHPYTVRDAQEWMKSLSASGDRAFLVTRADNGTVLGAAGSGAMNETDVEIGYWIGEPYWGNGYATEAVQALIDHIFAATALEHLYGRCRVVNAPSRRVLVKCGFQLLGSGMCGSRVLQGLVPVEEFVLERSVWSSLKHWGGK